MRKDKALVILAASLASALAGAGPFEDWQDAVDGGYTLSRPETTASGEGQAQPVRAVAAVKEQAEATENTETPLVRFGAGAAYLVAVWPSKMSVSDQVVSEFFFAVSPWRRLFELGADFSLTRDSRFFLRPNIKLLLVNRLDISLFLEGQMALYSHPGGTEIGWGGGLGGTMGIMENLALEVFTAVMVFDLGAEAAASLVGGKAAGNSPADSGRVFLPYCGARLVARF